jgi:hypothetical protein
MKDVADVITSKETLTCLFGNEEHSDAPVEALLNLMVQNGMIYFAAKLNLSYDKIEELGKISFFESI